MKLAINGFGRIGRQVIRVMLDRDKKGLPGGFNSAEVVAVNDLADPKTLAHLLKYDSIYGPLQNNIEAIVEDDKKAGEIVIDGKRIKVFTQPNPEKLPWSELDVDVVIESTGEFVNREGAGKHLTAGAKKVVISAPPKSGGIPTFLIGVNSDKQTGNEKIISNASCTTNCIAPIAAIMTEVFGVEKAAMTTMHAYTADQRLQDAPHNDLRRARAAGINLVPTTTGAAISTTEVVPALKDKFDGLAIRVPVIVGSIADFTFLVKTPTSIEEVNKRLVEACDQDPRYRGVVTYTNDPIVSTDIIKNPYSAIIDLSLTNVIDKDFVKVVAWYDNEWGYTQRLVELTLGIR